MQKLTMSEFKNLCSKMSNYHFLFDSVNQDWNKDGDSMKIRQYFDEIKISFNPNKIYLYSPSGKLVLSGVKYIEMDETTILGTIFTIICENFVPNQSNLSYTIIADKII